MQHSLRNLILLCTAAFIAGPAPSQAQTRPGEWRGPYVHRVAPELDAWFWVPQFRLARGRALPGGAEAASRLDRVGVTVRLRRVGDLRRLLQLEGSSFEVVRHGGRIARLGPIVCARLNRAGLARLRAADFVKRVELDMRRPAPPPLDHTAAEIQAFDVWATLTQEGLPITGHGVTIADIDAYIDVMHPHFFRADGGYYNWIDVDENGEFDPGVDGVDLDGDGLVAPEETVHFLDAKAYPIHEATPIAFSDDGVFDLGWDHLYVDENGNGVRDTGPEAGFTDADPGFGELLLLPDDVNGNGRLDVGEKLVALGTSKIRAAYDGAVEYLRGVSLSQVPMHEDSGHGTAVAGILVGGNRGLTTLVGIAPDAELLMTEYYTHWDGTYATQFTWAVQAGADVVLHEYAPWVGHFLDGSSNYEAMLDQAAIAGTAQVNPAGNLGGSQKASVSWVAPHAAKVITVALPPPEDPEGEEPTYLALSFLWRLPGRALTWTLETPGGEILDLGAGAANTQLADGTTSIWASRDDSSRGTAKVEITAWGNVGFNYVPIETGSWLITATDTNGATGVDPDVEIAGFVFDDASGWNGGSHFPDDSSEAHLIGFPGTSDSAITLAAYAGRSGEPYYYYPESAGQLRRFSGRGLRIDGVEILDIAAPDNPFTARNRTDDGEGGWTGFGAVRVFGGTSGAGPHVAGAAALIKQLHPDWSGIEVRSAIRDGALVDGDVTGDATHPAAQLWGAGKLRIFEALYGQSPAPNDAPTITTTPIYANPGVQALLLPEVSDTEDDLTALQLQWDDDYDGTWDTAPQASDVAHRVTFDATGTYTLKVQVIDTGGLTAEALAVVTVVDEPLCDGAPCPPEVPDEGCGCTASPAKDPSAPLLLLLVIGFLARRRRRR